MERIVLKPDRKLVTKLNLIILTISVAEIIFGIILQVTISLGRTSAYEAAIVIWPIIAASIFALWIIAAPIIILWVRNLEYFIEEERITIKKGIITKIQQNIPYRAITDFMLHRSLYDRILNIGSIRIQTAGQAVTPTGFEANLSGLLQWDDLLEELRSRLKNIHGDRPNVTPEIQDKNDVLNQILKELKLIRKSLDGKK